MGLYDTNGTQWVSNIYIVWVLFQQLASVYVIKAPGMARR